MAEISQDGLIGRGECVPYPRYGETAEAALRALEGLREPVAGGLDRAALQLALPAGAARNALESAGIEAGEIACRVGGII